MPSDLWSFATACYARPGVEATCLQLQEQGVDVCLLLCALWLEQRRVAAEPARLELLCNISRAWQGEVVMPLRALRQRWREIAAQDPALARLREQIKRTELEAEQELLGRLENVSAQWPPAASDASGGWLECLSQDRDALHRLRVAAATL